MKTTIDIPPALLEQTREHARAQGRTVKSVVEQALIEHLAEAEKKPKRVLRDASVPGWLTPEYQGKTITEMIYEDYEAREARVMHAGDGMLESDDRG